MYDVNRYHPICSVRGGYCLVVRGGRRGGCGGADVDVSSAVCCKQLFSDSLTSPLYLWYPQSDLLIIPVRSFVNF